MLSSILGLSLLDSSDSPLNSYGIQKRLQILPDVPGRWGGGGASPPGENQQNKEVNANRYEGLRSCIWRGQQNFKRPSQHLEVGSVVAKKAGYRGSPRRDPANHSSWGPEGFDFMSS